MTSALLLWAGKAGETRLVSYNNYFITPTLGIHHIALGIIFEYRTSFRPAGFYGPAIATGVLTSQGLV
jgi:hypothetical protein